MKLMISQIRRFALLLTAALLVPVVAQGQEPKKILLVTVTVGFPHSSIATAEKVLKEMGEKSGSFVISDIVGSGPRPRYKSQEKAWEQTIKQDLAEKMSPSELKKYDAIIFANTTGDLPVPDKAAFLQFIKDGKAFIGMHSASDTFHGSDGSVDPFIEMLGGEFLSHGPQVGVECINEDPQHPACAHIEGSWKIKMEEIYLLKNYHREKVHSLLSLEKHPNNNTPGHFPIAWCKNYGKGKVFYTSLGHREDVWESQEYQKHVLGGIRWALGQAPGSAEPQKK